MWDIRSPTRGGTCTPCAGKQGLNHRSPGKSPKYLSDHNERKLEVSNERKPRKATDTMDGKQHILREPLGQRSIAREILKRLGMGASPAAVRTQRFCCREPRFSPWSGNNDPANTNSKTYRAQHRSTEGRLQPCMLTLKRPQINNLTARPEELEEQCKPEA